MENEVQINNEYIMIDNNVNKKIKKITKRKRILILVDDDIQNIENDNNKLNIKPIKVITEDLGKIFEMAICLLYEIEYDGNFKYSLDEANLIKEKIHNLKSVFPYKIKHIAKNGNKYDFVCLDDENVFLSAKTTKKDGKVCPQVIGQPSKKKFCEYFKIDTLSSIEEIKDYIQSNIKYMLGIYILNTFACPIVYYNKHKNLILYIKLKEPINWDNYNIEFSHIVKNKKWNESSSIMLDNNSIGEFQVHNHRDCIKFRWYFEKILNLFKDNYDITDLQL